MLAFLRLQALQGVWAPHPGGSTRPARSQAASALLWEGPHVCEACVARIAWLGFPASLPLLYLLVFFKCSHYSGLR